MRSGSWRLALILSLIAAVPALASPVPAVAWRTEPVEAFGYGMYPDIAVDSLGRLHASARRGDDFVYYSNEMGAWLPRRVVAEGLYGDVTVDTADRVHLVHAEGRDEVWGGGLWVVHEVLADGQWVREAIALGHWAYQVAVGPDSVIHVLYRDTGTSGDLMYAWRDASGWHNETLAAEYSASRPDLAIDSTGVPHVAYSSCCPSNTVQAVYAKRVGGVWLKQPLELVTSMPALALGPDDSVHVVYSAGAAGLAYRHYATDGTWTKEVIPETTRGAWTPSIAVDSQNRPHIASADKICLCAYDPLYGHATYYFKDPLGRWVKTIVDAESWAHESRIIIDHWDTPRMVYGNLGAYSLPNLGNRLTYAEPVAAVPSRVPYAPGLV